MKNFQNSHHIWEGISNPSHTRGGMSRNDGGMEILYIFLDMRFGGVLNYARTHSRANPDVPTAFERQSKDCRIERFRRHLNCIPANRFRQQSKCIRGAFRLIRAAFGTFWQDFKWLAISILLRSRSECFECCWNAETARKNIYNAVRVQLEYTSNAVWYFPLRMHLECF